MTHQYSVYLIYEVNNPLKTYISFLIEKIVLDLDIGDIILGGKFKNKRMVVKSIDTTDDIGQPTINGKPILNFRIEKHLPDNMKSKKTRNEAQTSIKENNKSFGDYKRIRKSNLALFNALARRAKLAVRAMEKNLSLSETVELYKLLIQKYEMTEETNLDIRDSDVLEFIDAALTEPDKRARAKEFYVGAIKNIKLI